MNTIYQAVADRKTAFNLKALWKEKCYNQVLFSFPRSLSQENTNDLNSMFILHFSLQNIYRPSNPDHVLTLAAEAQRIIKG